MQEQLEKAARSGENERAEIIRALANTPDEALQGALDALAHSQKLVWEVAIELIRAIGYPKNALAISSLVAYVGNSNAPGWEMAVKTLDDLNASITVPYIIAYLLEKDQHQFWEDDVEGICLMLSRINKEVTKRCGPTIAYILGQASIHPSPDLDRGFLVEVLERIGSPDVHYALPALIDLANQEGASNIGRRARAFITSFSKQALEPYRQRLSTLE